MSLEMSVHLGNIEQGDKYCDKRSECIRCKLIDIGHLGHKHGGKIYCSLMNTCPYCLFLRDRLESDWAARAYAEGIKRNL